MEWTDYNDEVKLNFIVKLCLYLINLKIILRNMLCRYCRMNSKYAIILYRWLSMNYNQYEHYSVKGGRREEQVESYRNPEISMRDLRQMTDTIDEYKRFDHFEKEY